MPDAVSQRGEIFVCRILTKFQLVCPDVIVDFFAPKAKERPDDRQLDVVDPPRRNFAHCGKTCVAGATEQIDQKSLNQIVSVMRNEDGFAVSASCGFSKESVARLTCRSFDRYLLFLRERANVC